MDRIYENRSRVRAWITIALAIGIGSISLALVATANPSRAERDLARIAGELDLDAGPWSGEFEAEARQEIGGDQSPDATASWEIAPLEDPALNDGASAEELALHATELLRVDTWSSADGEGETIHLVADGVVESISAFTIENPNRLVIDLLGLRSVMTDAKIEVGSSRVERVRIGSHDDKVRVVLDAGNSHDAFDGRRVSPTATGLLVALGGGAELMDTVIALESSAQGVESIEQPVSETAAEIGLDEAIAALRAEMSTREESSEPELPVPTPAAPEVESMVDEVWALAGGEEPLTAIAPLSEPISSASTEEPFEENVSTHVYGVDLVSQDDVDRILVFGDRPSDYRLYEPDPETLVVSFDDARIADDAEVRLAPEESGPVSLVTAFQQPDVPGSEVRVVIKRAPNLVPRIERAGSQLSFEFQRAGESASPPPVLSALAAEKADETDEIPAEMAQQSPNLPAPTTTVELEVSDLDMVPAAFEAPVADVATAAPQVPELDVVPAALEPPAAIAILNEGGFREGKQYTGRRISLDFKDVDIADVLRLVAEVSDLNVVAGDEVSGQVTVRLVEVPWDQALDVILLTKGLGFERVGNVLRVAPATVLKQEEELRLQERRNLEALEDLVVKLQPVNYANVQDVSGMIQQLLTPRGTVNVDARTNTLIIKDIASVIDEATALVKAIDTQTPQVMIEAKIVEANLDFSREFGSTWSLGTQPLIDGFDSGSGARRDLGGDDFRFHDANNFSFGNPVAATSGMFNLAAFVVDEKMNLDLTLQAAEANGDGKVISSPRIVTLDNTRATIEQGVSIPFQTFENGDAQLEFIDAVLKLNVTPHITGDKSIIMKIEVSRNAPDDSVFTLTGSPAIAKNQVKTETLVADGQTLVLGGIYVIDKADTSQGVPLLKDIPGLGWAFKNKIVKDNRKELLMFVSPRIILSTPDAS